MLEHLKKGTEYISKLHLEVDLPGGLCAFRGHQQFSDVYSNSDSIAHEHTFSHIEEKHFNDSDIYFKAVFQSNKIGSNG